MASFSAKQITNPQVKTSGLQIRKNVRRKKIEIRHLQERPELPAFRISNTGASYKSELKTVLVKLNLKRYFSGSLPNRDKKRN